MQINIELSEEENLLNEINTANNSNHTLDTIKFGEPMVVDGVDPGTTTGRNTMVNVTALPKSKYEGSRVVKYRRIHIPTQWNIIHPIGNEITIDEEGSEANIINEIKTWFKYRDDSIKVTISKLDDKVYEVKLKANPTSLLYIGEITLRVITNGTEIKVPKNLNGFEIKNTN